MRLPREYLERAGALRDKKAAETSGEEPTDKGGKKYLMRRFWARWMDLTCYCALWWLGMYLVGQDIRAAIENPWLFLIIYLPWFIFEAFLIHKFGTTPGKWLLGIRVVNEDGSSLSLKQGIWRSLRVMVTGVGFGWGLLALFCQLMSWTTTRRIGKPVWDFIGKHRLEVKPVNPLGILVVIGLFIAAMQLQMAVRFPHERERMLKQFPQMEKYLQKESVYQFPVKK